MAIWQPVGLITLRHTFCTKVTVAEMYKLHYQRSLLMILRQSTAQQVRIGLHMLRLFTTLKVLEMWDS